MSTYEMGDGALCDVLSCSTGRYNIVRVSRTESRHTASALKIHRPDNYQPRSHATGRQPQSLTYIEVMIFTTQLIIVVERRNLMF